MLFPSAAPTTNLVPGTCADRARDRRAARGVRLPGHHLPGCYLIVQDGFVNGHPLEPEHGPGPYEAVLAFVAADDRFEVDRSRERMLFILNPGGFLRRR